MGGGPQKSLWRSLGEFVGHITHAVRTDPVTKHARRKVEVETRDTPSGPVTLRRTTIEEIEISPAKRSGDDHAQ